MNKNKTLWAVIAVVVIIGSLVFYRQWQMDDLIGGLNLDLENGLLSEPEEVDGETYLVPPEYVFDSGAELPALYDPNFTFVSDADSYLSDAVSGISIEIEGQQYFYSYQILNWHEVVNQTVGDQSLIVTHCVLCLSSAVYQVTDTFEHAGLVYNNSQLLMDASTESYWNQMTGMAIIGERAGEQLELVESEVMTWGEWKELYPGGSVLSEETGYDRDYGRHPFENYDIAEIYYFPMNVIDDRMAAKWIIDGLEIEDTFVAFSRVIMEGMWVLNFEIESKSLVAFYDTEDHLTRIFDPGEYVFDYDIEEKLFIDQNGSMWSTEGIGLSGDAQGEKMEEFTTNASFYMCWYANHTNTKIALIDLFGKTTESTDDEEDSTE